MEDGEDDDDIDDEQFMKMMGGMGGMGNQGPGQVPSEDEILIKVCQLSYIKNLCSIATLRMKQAELLMQSLFGAMGGAGGQGQAAGDD